MNEPHSIQMPGRLPQEREDDYLNRARAHLKAELAKVGYNLDLMYPSAIGGMDVNPEQDTVTVNVSMRVNTP